MGSHRAERSGPRRRIDASVTPRAGARSSRRPVAAPVETRPSSTGFDGEVTAALPLVDATGPGRRRAVKTDRVTHGRRISKLPPAPLVVGLAALAVAVIGAVTAADSGAGTDDSPRSSLTSVSALGGASDVYGSRTLSERAGVVSRDSERDALNAAADRQQVKAAEGVARQRNVALGALAEKAQGQAERIALNQWDLPVEPGLYHLTARFGAYGLWAGFHTGLDFAAPTGTPIRAVAAGVVTSATYDSAYGNRTVVTLADGTELWYCHQNEFGVSLGETVTPGQVIGYVGSTGHVTGPHLHLEVRPGAGDPVDPYAELLSHGVQP